MNKVETLFKIKKNELKMTDDDLAKILGVSREAVCRSINRPLENWRVATLVKYARALDINATDVADAVVESVKELQ